MTCGAVHEALDRFRRILVRAPGSRDAVLAAAEAASATTRPAAALRWAERARPLGLPAAATGAARLQAYVDLGRVADAVSLVDQLEMAGADVGPMLAQVASRALNGPGGAAAVDRLAMNLASGTLRRPAVATVAATAAFRRGAPARAAALLAAMDGTAPGDSTLRHEIALELGDSESGARAHDLARLDVLLRPDDVDTTLECLAFSLRLPDRNSQGVWRWTHWCACLAGSGLRSGPDQLFAECVRWKNDAGRRLNNRGYRIAHALGTLSAEAVLGGPVAVRNGADHARITIAGRELALRLASQQIRRMTATLFAFEPGMLRWFAGFEPSDVLVDVGANVGVYSVLAAGISGCRVVSIEPFSLNVAELQHNVAANGLGDRVTVLHAAATDRERIDTLYFGQSFAGAANQSFGHDDISAQYADRDAERETVRGIPLDLLVQRGEIPFPTHVKIDVDGLEEPVIDGMRGILSDPRFKSLRMEIRWHEEARRPLVDSILAQGYQVRIADDVKNLLFFRPPAV